MKTNHRGGRTLQPFICGESVCGEHHIRNNEVCQDASGWLAIRGRGKIPRSGVIVVADGLGSVLFPAYGAKTAIEAALSSARENLPAPVSDIPGILVEMTGTARNAVIREAVGRGCVPGDLACTLISVIYSRNFVAAAHIGDGCVIIRESSGELSTLTAPGTEYTNEVIPLTAPHWKSCLVSAQKSVVLGGVAVLTDGCVRAACSNSHGAVVPRPPFFDPLFSYVFSAKDEMTASDEIRSFLSGPGMTRSSGDDKTLVVGTIR